MSEFEKQYLLQQIKKLKEELAVSKKETDKWIRFTAIRDLEIESLKNVK